MQPAQAKQILTQHEPSRLYDVVELALADAEIRQILVEGSSTKDETVRYNCVRVLFRALDRAPQLFYQYWDRFAEMIDSPNGFHRSTAAEAIAYLASVDVDCRLDRLLPHYLALLEDPKVMVTHYFIDTLDRVCRARPDLQDRVLKSLLGIDKTSHTQQHKDMLRADILAVLGRLYDGLSIQQRKRSVTFAQAALDCTSPKARKAAKSFLAAQPG